MNVFMCWAGNGSKELATLMRDFLPVVVQECDPWMSEHDIFAGQPWDAELETALKAANFGVLCITPQNMQNAYLHYEAGAIANQVGERNRVCPLLLGGLQATQLAQPLGRFQCKPADRQGIWGLVQSLNTIAKKPINEPHLRMAFDGQWPTLQKNISEISLDPTVATPRSNDELLDEILQHVRILAAKPGLMMRSKDPEVLRRRYQESMTAQIQANLSGSFEWSVEDIKAKAVIATGIAATLAEAQEQVDVAANVPPDGPWVSTRKSGSQRMTS